jgi:hypothetical protein
MVMLQYTVVKSEILGWFQREMYRVSILWRCLMTEEDKHVPSVIIRKPRSTQILFDKFDIYLEYTGVFVDTNISGR